MNPEQLAYWYWLNDVKGIGPIVSKKLLDRFHTPEEVFKANKSMILGLTTIKSNIAENIEKSKSSFSKYIPLAEKQLNIAATLGGYILTSMDHPYSEIYRQCRADAVLPSIVHVLGNLECLGLRKFAIVGTRNPTLEGKERAFELAKSLVANNFCIVSGLAVGIDTQGHKGSLESDGKTIAVLGSGADVCYPSENLELYTRIKQKGLVVSEFPFGVRTTGENLRQRNRTIVALSEGVAVAECPLKSGAMIASRFVAQQKKPLFAFSSSNTNNSGGEWLIKNSLAIKLKDVSVSVILQNLSEYRFPEQINVDKVFQEIWPKRTATKKEKQANVKQKTIVHDHSGKDISNKPSVDATPISKQPQLPLIANILPTTKIEKQVIAFEVKDNVTHPAFGAGQIISIIKTKDDYQLTIQFSNKEVRTLSWRYSKLTKEK